MVQKESWSQGVTHWFRHAWQRATAPSAEIRDAGQRRQAELLAALLIFLSIVSVGGILGSFGAAGISPSFFVQMPLLIGSLVAYALSRTRYFRIATWILALGTAFLGYADAAYSQTPVEAVLIFVTIAYLIVVGIFTWTEIAVFSSILMAASWVLPLLSPVITTNNVWTIFGQEMTYGLLAIGVVLSRNAAERDRIEEVVRTSEELQQISNLLEQRVVERTRDIALAAEIGRRVTMVRDLKTLLAEAVVLIRDRFDLYYTQIYLADARSQSLVVRAGTGRIGEEMMRRGHRLAIDLTSLNGTAALEHRAVIVGDTSRSLIFKPNPLLPETRSEMAIPLIAGERVLGVLDLQSSTPNGLTEDDLPAFETLAGQLATALLNAELFSQVQRTLDVAEERTRRQTRRGWNDFLNAIDQKESLGFRYEGGMTVPLAEPLTGGSDPLKLAAPIQVTGEPVGLLELHGEAPWKAEDVDMVNQVAAQLAQQVENLRLLNQAERYRGEMEAALRRATREEWQAYAAETEKGPLAYQYTGQEVTELPVDATPESSYSVELKVQNEVIGKLGLQDLESLSADDQALVSAISEQLSAHLENMRLFASAQREIAERARTEQALDVQLADTEALYNVTNRLARARSQKEILDAVVDGTVMHAFDSATLYFFDQPWLDSARPKLLITEAFWERVPGSSSVQMNLPMPLQAVPEIEQLADHPYHFVADARTHDGLDDLQRQMLLESKMVSVLNVRLVVGGEWLGVISAACETPQVVTEADVRRLLILVDQAAVVFYGLLQYQSTQARARREQTLREITARVRSSMDPEVILRTAVRELGNALGRQTFVRLGSSEQLLESTSSGGEQAPNGKNGSAGLTGEGGE